MKLLKIWLQSIFVLYLFAAQTVASGCSPKTVSPGNSTGNVTVVIPTRPPAALNSTEPLPEMPLVQLYTYQIVATYPHDTAAFTEGLAYHNGQLYESTGLKGQSSLRKVELQTGKVLQIRNLSPDLFGEGIAVYGDGIVLLTWQDGKGYVFDKAMFQQQREFDIDTEGWGITSDGRRLIMSDGTSVLHVLSPPTFENIGDINVSYNGSPVDKLNELEYVGGLIYANVWQTDKIAIIDPGSGRVNGWVDLTGLLPQQGKAVDVLNGIAFDAAGGRLFVTGKYWPSLFEIKLVRTN